MLLANAGTGIGKTLAYLAPASLWAEQADGTVWVSTYTKALQRQLALMGRAVAGMAHRIKNILMGLEGGIFVVNEGIASGDQEGVSEGWEMVERNVELVSSVIGPGAAERRESEEISQVTVLPAVSSVERQPTAEARRNQMDLLAGDAGSDEPE